MRNHVALREITACAEFTFHIVIEREVDINRAIGRAVEWPHHRLAGTAAGPGRATVHHQTRRLIGFPHLFKLLRPGVFGRGKDNRGEFCRFIIIRVADALRALLLALTNGLAGHQAG